MCLILKMLSTSVDLAIDQDDNELSYYFVVSPFEGGRCP